MVCPWPFMEAVANPVPIKSFVQALSTSCDTHLYKPPPKVVFGDTIRVRISQDEYETGIADCKSNLHGRVTLSKGGPPLTTKMLKLKLEGLWSSLKNWTVITLGKGFFEFKFQKVDDMRKVWALRLLNLKPGLLRFYCWTRDFNPQNQVQTHAQVWIRLMHLPQEYWRRNTLFEISSGIGTPLTIDEATEARLFSLYARVLVDIDMADKLFDSVFVEREGHAFPVAIQYEKHTEFCANCKLLGHNIQNCKKIGSMLNLEGTSKVTKKSNNEQALLKGSDLHKSSKTKFHLDKQTTTTVTLADLPGKPSDTSLLKVVESEIVQESVKETLLGSLQHAEKDTSDTANATFQVESMIQEVQIEGNIANKVVVPKYKHARQGIVDKEVHSSSQAQEIVDLTTVSKANTTTSVEIVHLNKEMDHSNVPLVDNVVSHQNITLHNSFNALNADRDLPLGEALDDGTELDVIVYVHKENAAIEEVVMTEAPIPVEIRPNMSTSTPYGEHSLELDPKGPLSKPLQNFVAGPSASSGSDSLLMPSVFPQPITTYHSSLSTEKLPVLEPVNTLVHTTLVCSSKVQRSVDILIFFWGDCIDEELEFNLVSPSTARNKNQKKQTKRQA